MVLFFLLHIFNFLNKFYKRKKKSKLKLFISLFTKFKLLIVLDTQNFHRKLGIFPVINRVWVIIDQEFFLWDYSEG